MSEPLKPRLTGPDLLSLVESMPRATKTELVRAAGYVADDGRRLFTEFYAALLEANGHGMPGQGDGRSCRAVSFRTTVLSHGGLLIGKRYVQDALGLERGQRAEIRVKDGELTLVPEIAAQS